MTTSHTNTSLATARRCLREWDLGYRQQLSPALGDSGAEVEAEELSVGKAWHAAHDAETKGRDPYEAIRRYAPWPIWIEKLSRLFAAYAWYWQEQPIEVVESELVFRMERFGHLFEGQIDGGLRSEDARRGIIERKTTDQSVEPESAYWGKLRLDAQVGIYGLATDPLPDFILYDVVRKPTIRPKTLTKEEVARMRKELDAGGPALYYGEAFDHDEDLSFALEYKQETVKLYGARLTADIGDRPSFYFARREVPRTTADYLALGKDLSSQASVLGHAEAVRAFPRNPDACLSFGRVCRFFGLCSNNVHPETDAGDPIPQGFRRRELLHPELPSPLPTQGTVKT